MPGSRLRGLLAIAALPFAAAATDVYSKLEPGSKCADYIIPGVATKEDCFGIAADRVGLSSVPKLELNGIGFRGCVRNVGVNLLMFGSSPGVDESNSLVLPNFEYICNGIPTTTTTTTVTVTSQTVTTTTGLINRIPGGKRCQDFLVGDIATQNDCFTVAAPVVGLADKATLQINGIGFTGCLYNSAANLLMYGVSDGVSPQDTLALPTFEYICDGLMRTSTSTTATDTTTTETVTGTTTTTYTTTTAAYHMTAGGKTCSGDSFKAVNSMYECFNVAGPLIGLSGKTTVRLDGIGFSGCIYNSAADTLMYGETMGITDPMSLALESWRYICPRPLAQQQGVIVLP